MCRSYYNKRALRLTKLFAKRQKSTTPATQEVIVIQSSDNFINTTSTPYNNTESMKLVDKLLQRTSEMIDPQSANVVAFSGGVDSSLVAALVHSAFTNYDFKKGSVQAVLGISPAVPQTQIQMARQVAQTIGISLKEVNTTEGDDETYVKNDGYACYVCKTHLYSTLESVANEVMKKEQNVILYNGTNADDKLDSTRVGLIAASNFEVQSPLDRIIKDQVRQAAKYLGLPNWNAAASPCLRSRLAMGVMATEHHLLAVEKAERFLREVLQLDDTINARVRMLAGGKAVVELDNSIMDPEIERVLQDNLFEQKCIQEWGFQSFGGVRAFKTGSVAAAAKTLATAA
jgi:pyridinium-3,5-biscarboxylic acid mononucleotide sulfurtransferase